MLKKIFVSAFTLVLMVSCFSVLKASSHEIFSDETSSAAATGPFLNFNISGGYTAVSMQNVNNVLKDDQSSWNGGILNTTGNAFYIALDINVPIFNVINIGPRIEYINVFEGNFKYVNTTFGVNVWDAFGASLIPLYLGISYSYGFGDSPISVSGGIYGGYGFASGYRNINATVLNINLTDTNIPLYGSGFMGEAILSGDYNFSKSVSLGLNFGYRTAGISQMKASNDVLSGIINIKKGDVLKDPNGKTLPFDYSGLLVGLSFHFGF